MEIKSITRVPYGDASFLSEKRNAILLYNTISTRTRKHANSMLRVEKRSFPLVKLALLFPPEQIGRRNSVSRIIYNTCT